MRQEELPWAKLIDLAPSLARRHMQFIKDGDLLSARIESISFRQHCIVIQPMYVARADDEPGVSTVIKNGGECEEIELAFIQYLPHIWDDCSISIDPIDDPLGTTYTIFPLSLGYRVKEESRDR